MTWLQLKLETSADLAPQCEDALLQLGAAAVTLQDNADQPLFDQGLEEPPLWRETRVTGLFPASTDMAALWDKFPQELAHQCQHRAEILEDKDWEREWMQNYQAMQFAPSLWICPSWQAPPDPEATTILLDPGLAFGTGTHPTTAMGLTALSGLKLDGRQVLDYGCGSGILAIATLLLGAESAVGVDTDPLALKATTANCERNSIAASRIQTLLHGELESGRRFDLVLANILAGPLCDLAPLLTQHLHPGAQLILSGILSEQVEAINSAYAGHLELQQIMEQDGWVVLSGTRP